MSGLKEMELSIKTLEMWRDVCNNFKPEPTETPFSQMVEEFARRICAAKQDQANPFVREGEKTFMRHDELRIIQEQPGQMAVEFRWQGTPTYTMRVECDFSIGQTLTLTGVEGRMAAQIRQG